MPACTSASMPTQMLLDNGKHGWPHAWLHMAPNSAMHPSVVSLSMAATSTEQCMHAAAAAAFKAEGCSRCAQAHTSQASYSPPYLSASLSPRLSLTFSEQ